jgi:hypothetical protein
MLYGEQPQNILEGEQYREGPLGDQQLGTKHIAYTPNTLQHYRGDAQEDQHYDRNIKDAARRRL